MFKNYLIVAVRNLLRHRGNSAISIAGLAVGMASCMIIVLYVHDEVSYDRFHANAASIYRITSDERLGDRERQTATTPPGLARLVAESFPEVEEAARLWRDPSGAMTVRYEDRAFPESRFVFADSNVFDVFSFTLLAGEPETALRDPFSLVITESAARKYFGEENPLGKSLIVREPADRDLFEYRVTAVAADPPSQSHIQFDFLASLSTQRMSRSASLLDFGLYTYILLRNDAVVEGLDERISRVVRESVAPQVQDQLGTTFNAYIDGGHFRFALQPLRRIHLHSNVVDEFGPVSDVRYVYFLGAVAIFILVLACANFVNLTTALAVGRAREVGMRKALGSGTGQLVRQFLCESSLQSAAASVFAVALAGSLLSNFSEMTGKDLSAAIPPAGLAAAWVAVFALLVGVAAGSYPAFVLSAVRPITALKTGIAGRAGGSRLRRTLIVFQLVVSVVLTAGTVVVHRQLGFIQEKRLGFEAEQVIVLEGAEVMGRQIEAFKQEAMALSGVISAANSELVPGTPFSSALFRAESTSMDALVALEYTYVGFDFAETLGLDITMGRALSREQAGDSLGVMLNESAVKSLGLTDPIGKRLIWPNESVYMIVGVVRDFHVASLRKEISPLALLGPDPRNTNRPNLLVSVRVAAQDLPLTIAGLETTWRTFAPNQPFIYRFLDDDFDAHYHRERLLRLLFGIFAFIALFLACIGLLGLASLTTRQRTREIGVRRVLGASVGSILSLLSRDFLKLAFVALILAAPLAYFAMHRWLDGFAYRIDLGPGIILLVGFGVLLVVLLAVSYQSIKAALADPVASLRHE